VCFAGDGSLQMKIQELQNLSDIETAKLNRDLGKIDDIPPAGQTGRESTLRNVAGFTRELVYTGSFGLGNGVAFLGYSVSRLLIDYVPPVGRGMTEGTTNAAADARKAADQVTSSMKGALGIGME